MAGMYVGIWAETGSQAAPLWEKTLDPHTTTLCIRIREQTLVHEVGSVRCHSAEAASQRCGTRLGAALTCALPRGRLGVSTE